LIAISNAMVEALAEARLPLPDRPVVVAHSPASVQPDVSPRAETSDPPRIGYVGSLYPGRGVELVTALAARMPGFRFELIGGSDRDLERWRERALPLNVRLRGFVAPSELSAVYRELDVLLMPYPQAGIHAATQQIDTSRYCSPMKMFEYMASGVPIVASDLRVLQEVLAHERNALIAPSGDVAAWQLAIERLVRDRRLRIELASRALGDVIAYTPAARTAKIFRGLGLVD